MDSARRFAACLKTFIYRKASLFWKPHLCCQITDFDWPVYISASANVGWDIWSKGHLDASWTQLMLILERYQERWMCSFASVHIEHIVIPTNLMQLRMNLNLLSFFHSIQLKPFFLKKKKTSYFVTISVQRSENNMVARTKMDLHDSFYKNSSLSFSLKERGKKEKITFWMIIWPRSMCMLAAVKQYK